MKKLSFTLFLGLICSFGIAQSPEAIRNIDSLKYALAQSKSDSNRVIILSDLSLAYQFTKLDSLQKYSEKGLKLSQQIDFPRGEASILNSLGTVASFQGNIPKALKLLFQGLRIAEKNHYPLETAICLNSISASYWFLDDFTKAIAFSRRAIKIDENIHHKRKDIYWKLYIEIWNGLAYLGGNKLDSANFILQKAYKEAFNPDFTDLYIMRPVILMVLSEVQFKLGNHSTAFNILHQSIESYKKNGDPFGVSDACTFMAGFYKETNQPDSLIYFAKQGLDAAKKFDYKSGILKNSKILAEYYDSKDANLAHFYLKQVLEANESLYGAKVVQELQKTLSEDQQRQREIEEKRIAEENRLNQYYFLAGLGVLLLVAFFLYRNNRQNKKANAILQVKNEEIQSTLSKLKSTQAQLIQSEKLASLGELTAGIAHEIQNPLNFVNNFSEVSSELVSEMKEELAVGNQQSANEIADDLKSNLEKITLHGKRASSIVKGMLEHSKASSGEKELTDINTLADEYLRLAYHGLRAKDKNFNSDFKTDFYSDLPKIAVIPQDIGRVLLNLINNAFYAVKSVDKPMVEVTTKNADNQVIILVKDNGIGMSKEIQSKIFQPFFTTKPTGQGTGLGLSLAYDIVTKGHGGELKVETREGEGSIFTIQLPIA